MNNNSLKSKKKELKDAVLDLKNRPLFYKDFINPGLTYVGEIKGFQTANTSDLIENWVINFHSFDKDTLKLSLIDFVYNTAVNFDENILDLINQILLAEKPAEEFVNENTEKEEAAPSMTAAA